MASARCGSDVDGFTYRYGQPTVERVITHYSNMHQILLVGEGDFSFSSALANAFGSARNMVATSLDSQAKVLRVYQSARITLCNLQKRGATVLHEVDATKMEDRQDIREVFYDRIVYNFPHAGFHGKEDDKNVIKRHRRLVKMFFQSSRTKLSRMGEIHVAHKETYPYNKWKLEKQAKNCGLSLKESVEFNRADYPGYVNRRGNGRKIGKTFRLGACRTYKFTLSTPLFPMMHLSPRNPERPLNAGNDRWDARPFPPGFPPNEVLPLNYPIGTSLERRYVSEAEEVGYGAMIRRRTEDCRWPPEDGYSLLAKRRHVYEEVQASHGPIRRLTTDARSLSEYNFSSDAARADFRVGIRNAHISGISAFRGSSSVFSSISERQRSMVRNPPYMDA